MKTTKRSMFEISEAAVAAAIVVVAVVVAAEGVEEGCFWVRVRNEITRR